MTALWVSQSWLAAVKSMASLQQTVEEPSAPLREVAGSVMGRHFTQLGSEGKSVSLSADSFFILAHHMAHLRVLFGKMQLDPPQGWLTFPRGLQELYLQITRAGTSAELNAALKDIGRVPELDALTITLPFIDEQLSFAPLALLPLLRRFTIVQPDNGPDLSDAQVAELRKMPLLEQLDVQPMSTPLLRRLLKQPHNLQWQHIGLPQQLDDDVAALLPQLPSLTQLGTPTVFTTCSHFDFLRQLPKLIKIVLGLSESEDAPGRFESLIGGLQCCTEIEVLTLVSTEVTTAHLNELLSRLPRLHTLALGYANITTLSFLAQPPMTVQLASLVLADCKRLPLTELRHVHALRGLETLALYQSFTASMDEHCQSLYTPPSPLLPQLQKFKYRQ